jgi:hypothetical protein
VVVDAARSLPAATARSAALGTLLVLSMDATHRQAISAAGEGVVMLLSISVHEVHAPALVVAHLRQGVRPFCMLVHANFGLNMWFDNIQKPYTRTWLPATYI